MFASNMQPPKKPLKEKPHPWLCTPCKRSVPGYWARCPDCHKKRP